MGAGTLSSPHALLPAAYRPQRDAATSRMSVGRSAIAPVGSRKKGGTDASMTSGISPSKYGSRLGGRLGSKQDSKSHTDHRFRGQAAVVVLDENGNDGAFDTAFRTR